MKLHKELLIELFDSAAIKEPRISDYTYEVEQEVGGRTITFIAMRSIDDEDNEWRIDFAEHLGADVDEPFVSHKTGKGKEFQVFSFVIACAKDFVKKKNPQKIILRSSKSEPTRGPLYARLAKKFGSDFDIADKSSSWQNVTVLTRKS